MKTIGSMFRKPKDKPEKDKSTAVVYQIDCKNCEKVYIGQTSRALKTRSKEHKRAIFLGDANSLLAQHQTQTQHEFDVDNAQIIDKCQQWSGRLFLEAWHSIPPEQKLY